MGKIAIVSHCLLNNISKVEPFENRNKELIRFLLDNDFELIQMPCPEFTLYGGRRFGQVKEQYDTPFFRQHCRSLIEPLVQQIKEYERNGHGNMAIFAIKGSPSCGYKHTVSAGTWMGEAVGKKLEEAKLVQGSGVFIEELLTFIDDTSIIEVDEENIETTIEQCKELFNI